MDKVFVGNIVKFEHQGNPVIGIIYEADKDVSRVQTLAVVDGQIVRSKIKGVWNKELTEAKPEELQAFVAALSSTHTGIDNQIAALEAAIKEMKEKVAALKAQRKAEPDVTLDVPEFTPEIIIAEEKEEYHGYPVQYHWDEVGGGGESGGSEEGEEDNEE